MAQELKAAREHWQANSPKVPFADFWAGWKARSTVALDAVQELDTCAAGSAQARTLDTGPMAPSISEQVRRMAAECEQLRAALKHVAEWSPDLEISCYATNRLNGAS